MNVRRLGGASDCRSDACREPRRDGARRTGLTVGLSEGRPLVVGLYYAVSTDAAHSSAAGGLHPLEGIARPDGLDGMEAFRVPVGGFSLRPPACPAYVVGDAGGFADALTGEGIYSALESGRLAGEVAVDEFAYGRWSPLRVLPPPVANGAVRSTPQSLLSRTTVLSRRRSRDRGARRARSSGVRSSKAPHRGRRMANAS